MGDKSNDEREIIVWMAVAADKSEGVAVITLGGNAMPMISFGDGDGAIMENAAQELCKSKGMIMRAKKFTCKEVIKELMPTKNQ